LSGSITVPEDALQQVRRALGEHIRATLAEPGWRAFDVKERAHGVFDVSEVFADEAAFRAHQERVRGSAWEIASTTALRSYKTWTA
jgi:quinol monooxygenase YgiN